MIHTHHIPVTRTARYYTAGNINQQTEYIWFVLHGYAQLAHPFLESFNGLFSATSYFVAPEGLNRFYSKGLSGKPVTNWMTSEDRENEIRDYVNFLNTLYESVVPLDFQGKIIVLGFSQGVATASRWIHNTKITPHRFIVCSGDIAKELRNPVSQKLKQIPVIYITGNSDPLLRNEIRDEVHSLMAELRAEVITFDGGHELHLPSLKKISLNL